ncbi:MAG: kelch repeat-containing protein [Pseudomonadota bacterium]
MSPERVETATSGWSTSTPLPLAVQEIYPTALQGRIHLAGGFVAESGAITGPTNAHQVFDPERGAWSAGLPLPTARHHPHLIAFDGHLIALGGFETPSADAIWVMQSSGWAITADMATWESAAGENAPMESWASVPTLPRPAGEAVTAVIDANLHLVGGRRPAAEANATWQDHTDTSEHFILGGLDSVWETAAPIPTARNSAAASMIGENWHVVGGRTVADGNTSAHEVYDAREDRWRTVAPLPQGQGGLAAASLGGKLYAFGGEYFQPSPGGVFSESWVYSPNEDAWSSIPEMPSPRHGLGAVTLNDEIYVIGGALGVGGQETSARVEIFTPQ